MEVINTIGRRKAAVARIYLSQGEGRIQVNGKKYTDYFPETHISQKLTEPFRVLEMENGYDIKVNVYGGGVKGQAEAIRLAVARALVTINEEYKKPLKDEGLLTRDARVVERKKYGKPKARKSFQFSKR